MIKMLVDTELRRPGCAILQAVAGGDRGLLFQKFNPDTWLLAPTDHMVLISGTKEQWEKFIEEANNRLSSSNG